MSQHAQVLAGLQRATAAPQHPPTHDGRPNNMSQAGPPGPGRPQLQIINDLGERQPLIRRSFRDQDPSQPNAPLYSCVSNPHSHLPVYTNIHRIRRDIISVVEDYLSQSQLNDVRINITVVRPIVDKLYELGDISIGECVIRPLQGSRALPACARGHAAF